MGNASARFFNEKGVRAFRRSHFYSAEMEAENKQVFSGTAREAIGDFPPSECGSGCLSWQQSAPRNYR